MKRTYNGVSRRELSAPRYSRGQESPQGKKKNNRECQRDRKKFKASTVGAWRRVKGRGS